MKKIFLVAGILFFLSLQLSFVPKTHAQFRNLPTPTEIITITPTATPSATPTPKPQKKDVTKPEGDEDRKEFLALFNRRPAKEPTITNFIAYGVQYAVRQGVPVNTIMLILLLPFLATIVVFFRYIVGLPSLGLLVPIALSITLLSTGLVAGLILLATIFIASILARFLLKRIRIMQLPKLALSMWLVSVAIIVALTICAANGILSVRDISIFPILLLVLLSDRVVALFLERSLKEVVSITLVTLFLGVIGFFLLSWAQLRDIIILYPELVLLFVPINILMGRYFGLRVSEYIRFKPIRDYGSK
jgi:hypothetical protein